MNITTWFFLTPKSYVLNYKFQNCWLRYAPKTGATALLLWGRFQYLMFHYKVDVLELFLKTAKHTSSNGLMLLKIFYWNCWSLFINIYKLRNLSALVQISIMITRSFMGLKTGWGCLIWYTDRYVHTRYRMIFNIKKYD